MRAAEKLSVEKGKVGGGDNVAQVLQQLLDLQQADKPPVSEDSTKIGQIFRSLVKSEMWVSTWPGNPAGGGTQTGESLPSCTARFKKIVDPANGPGIVAPTFYVTDQYHPDDVNNQDKKQQWIASATHQFLTDDQLNLIRSTGTKNEPVFAFTILPVNSDRSINTVRGKVVKDIDPSTKYFVFGRGSVGSKPYNYKGGLSGPGQYHADTLCFELSSDESAQAFLETLKSDAKVDSDELLASFSLGLSDWKKFANLQEGNLNVLKPALKPENPNNPFSKNVKFIVENRTGLK